MRKKLRKQSNTFTLFHSYYYGVLILINGINAVPMIPGVELGPDIDPNGIMCMLQSISQYFTAEGSLKVGKSLQD